MLTKKQTEPKMYSRKIKNKDIVESIDEKISSDEKEQKIIDTSVKDEIKKIDPENIEHMNIECVKNTQNDQKDIEKKSPKKKKTTQIFNIDDMELFESDFNERIVHLDKLREDYSVFLTETKHYLQEMFKTMKRIQSKELKNKEKKDSRVKIQRIAPEFIISKELCEFMGLKEGSKTSRNNAISFVSQYAKTNNLGGMEIIGTDGLKKIDKRYINLDEKLIKLFPKIGNEKLTYQSLMKQLSQHFPSKIIS